MHYSELRFHSPIDREVRFPGKQSLSQMFIGEGPWDQQLWKGEEGCRTWQRERLSCDAVLTKASRALTLSRSFRVVPSWVNGTGPFYLRDGQSLNMGLPLEGGKALNEAVFFSWENLQGVDNWGLVAYVLLGAGGVSPSFLLFTLNVIFLNPHPPPLVITNLFSVSMSCFVLLYFFRFHI